VCERERESLWRPMLQGLPGFCVGVRGGLKENIPDSGYKYLDEKKVRVMCERERERRGRIRM
jgi:hypothetical protein